MKGRNLRIALVAAFAAALGLALIAAFDLGSPPVAGSVPAPAAPASDPAREVRPLRDSSSGSPHEERTALPFADPSTAPAAEGELVEVEIVRADTGAPVPDANVWWWPKPSPFGGDDGLEEWLRRGVAEDRTEEAQELQADARGRVRVADAERGFYVAAASGDLWGYGSFGADREPPARVALAPDRDVRVQVLDAKGAPVVGALVALRQRRLSSLVDHLTARTRGPEGIAVLRHAGHFLGPRLDSKEPFLVALPGLLDPPLERAFDPRRPPDEVARLVLGPTGSCEVSVVDERGEAVGGPFEARLRFADAGGGGSPPGSRTCGEVLHSRNGGRVVFERVGLGRALAVTVTREGAGALEEVRGLGPSSPGERVELRVRVGADVAVLRGRLVDSAGVPVADAAFRARLEARDPREPPEAAWLARSDADGRFSVDAAPMAEVPEGLALAVHPLSEDGVELGAARRALPLELRAGSHELGEFALAAAPVAAEGIVVDGEGNPIPRATVTPSIPLPRTVDGSAAKWPECRLGPARTDARGRFVLRGEAGSDRISLSAEKEGLVGDPVVVQAGTRGVELALGAAGAIEGTVLLGPSLLGAMALVQAVPDLRDPERAAAPSAGPVVLGRDGRFALRGLRPGTYSVRVVHAATAIELGKVEIVAVGGGETTRDPRLDPLDLRATYRLVALELVDERDQPISHGRAFSRPSGEADAKWSCTREDGGRLSLLTDGRPLDVAISAEGFRRVELYRVDAPRRVTLRRAARLRLEIAGGLRLPETLCLGAELTPLEAGRFAGFADSRTGRFDAVGVLACESAFAGDLRLELFLTRRDRASPSIVYVEEDAPRTLAVADHDSEQRFEIRLDPARIDAAVRSFLEER